MMKKFSFLIVCLCATFAFVCQAQDTEGVSATVNMYDVNGDSKADVSDLTTLIDELMIAEDAPMLNSARPTRPFEPIGPGPQSLRSIGILGQVTAMVVPGSVPNLESAGDTPTQEEDSANFGDVNGDGTVDISDVTALIDALLTAECAPMLNGARPTLPYEPIGPGGNNTK